ncbi:glycosyltransferase [Roseibium denhamense]|uniref:Predicted glycosyl transferase n=1 Tax=Roseibium denhamense TaxID=76305 RepID=A0ABY1PPN7_9HYPH|nr:glycosyltransferase [Roseibium denhamense]MTI05778.1 glycosyltransferase [Roseibium denhamense]SMP37009.1 Predicted glycosyl transferase [Roseibium denhamense]
MTVKAFIHVQHLLGTGHVVRAAAIGKALAAKGAAVTLATGNKIPPTLDTGPLDIVELPACKSADATFKSLVTLDNEPIDETWKSARVKASIQAFSSGDYDLLLTETYPFGRRQLDFELTPLLEAAKKNPKPPLIATSIRDILVRKKEAWKEKWMADQALRFYDRILVHSDPDFIQLSDSFPFADRVEPLVRYTGYVGPEARPAAQGDDGRDELIISCGGGAVAAPLIEAALNARSLSHKAGGTIWRLLVGHDVGEDAFQRYRQMAPAGLIVERARRDFPDLLKRARLSVSQAGYNTVLDVLTAGLPAVFVPFAQADETEQTQRAEALARHGRAVVVSEAGLTPARLAARIDDALSLELSPHQVQLGGAQRSAEILLADLKDRF